MAINAVRAVGDDQAWKREVETVISELRAAITVLSERVNTLERRAN